MTRPLRPIQIESGWRNSGVIMPTEEFDATGRMIEERLIQEILDSVQVPDESVAGYLERYYRARDEVRRTPLPPDFDTGAVLRQAMEDVVALNRAVQMGYRQGMLERSMSAVALQECEVV